jgi:hypothetical protein
MILSAVILLSPAVAYARPAASQFTVVVAITPAVMPYNAYPTLRAHTRINSQCTARVTYKDGTRPSDVDSVTKHAGSSGIATWRWHETTRSGGGTALVTCRHGALLATGHATFVVQKPAPHHVAPPVTSAPNDQYATSSDAPGVRVFASNLHADTGNLFTPPSGDVFAVVRITITNDGSQAYPCNSLDFSLQDTGSHVQYTGDALDDTITNTSLHAGELVPGQTVAGDVAFTVPQGTKRVLLWWTPSFQSSPVTVPFHNATK